MSDRKKPHDGRDLSGKFKVKQADVDELLTNPEGGEFVRDDVRLGGAIEDTGPQAGGRGKHIEELIEENRGSTPRGGESGSER